MMMGIRWYLSDGLTYKTFINENTSTYITALRAHIFKYFSAIPIICIFLLVQEMNQGQSHVGTVIVKI